jgi:hypothetical protein
VTAVAGRTAATPGDVARLAESLVRWLETGERPGDLFADGVFADFTLPHWRLQAEGSDATFRLREESHPAPGRVTVESLDTTGRGFLVAIEERWLASGQHWYCREMLHCVVVDGRVVELAVYCTGDWDEDVQRRHAEQVRLIRP